MCTPESRQRRGDEMCCSRGVSLFSRHRRRIWTRRSRGRDPYPLRDPRGLTIRETPIASRRASARRERVCVPDRELPRAAPRGGGLGRIERDAKRWSRAEDARRTAQRAHSAVRDRQGRTSLLVLDLTRSSCTPKDQTTPLEPTDQAWPPDGDSSHFH